MERYRTIFVKTKVRLGSVEWEESTELLNEAIQELDRSGYDIVSVSPVNSAYSSASAQIAITIGYTVVAKLQSH